jgi:hypothetical protein
MPCGTPGTMRYIASCSARRTIAYQSSSAGSLRASLRAGARPHLPLSYQEVRGAVNTWRRLLAIPQFSYGNQTARSDMVLYGVPTYSITRQMMMPAWTCRLLCIERTYQWLRARITPTRAVLRAGVATNVIHPTRHTPACAAANPAHGCWCRIPTGAACASPWSMFTAGPPAPSSSRIAT